MPTISMFYGILVAIMFESDKKDTHFNYYHLV